MSFERLAWSIGFGSALFLIPIDAYAQAPNVLTYQGRLEESGTPVTGSRSVDVRLCDALTGGACTNTGAQGVSVDGGLFRTTFTVPAAVNLGTGNWFLEVVIGGATLSPRERLSSTPFSLVSSSATSLIAAPGQPEAVVSTSMAISGSVRISTTNASTALVVGGTVTAAAFAGDGSRLTGVPGPGFVRRFTRSLIAFNASDATKDALCQTEFGSEFVAQWHGETGLYRFSAVPSTAPISDFTFNVAGEASASIDSGPGNGANSAGNTTGGNYSLACTHIRAPLRFTRGTTSFAGTNATKDGLCSGEFGNGFMAATTLDLSSFEFIGPALGTPTQNFRVNVANNTSNSYQVGTPQGMNKLEIVAGGNYGVACIRN